MSEFNEVARHGALKELNDKKQDSDDDIAEELSIEMSSGTSEEDEGLPGKSIPLAPSTMTPDEPVQLANLFIINAVLHFVG